MKTCTENLPDLRYSCCVMVGLSVALATALRSSSKSSLLKNFAFDLSLNSILTIEYSKKLEKVENYVNISVLLVVKV